MNGFSEGTILITQRGLVPIKDIKEDDLVMNSKGRLSRIEKIESFQSESLIVLKDFIGNEIKCTPDTEFFNFINSSSGEALKASNSADVYWGIYKVNIDDITDSGIVYSLLELNNTTVKDSYPEKLFRYKRNMNLYKVTFLCHLIHTDSPSKVYNITLKKSKGILANGIIFSNS